MFFVFSPSSDRGDWEHGQPGAGSGQRGGRGLSQWGKSSPSPPHLVDWQHQAGSVSARLEITSVKLQTALENFLIESVVCKNEFEFSFRNAQKSFKTNICWNIWILFLSTKFDIQRAATRAPQWTATWPRASSTSPPAWTTWAGCWGARPATPWSNTRISPRSGISTSAVSTESYYHSHLARL